MIRPSLLLRRLAPNWTGQLNRPNRAAQVQGSFHFHESWSFPAGNPNVSIGGLFAQKLRNRPSNAPELRFDAKTHSFTGSPGDQERFLSLGDD